MSLLQTIREGISPALTHSRRMPDPGKVCEAPSCCIRFFRKPKESLNDYKARTTCCKTCERELLVLNSPPKEREETYKQIDPTQLSCGNCHYMREDSELGEHCGPCTEGQKFKMKERRSNSNLKGETE